LISGSYEENLVFLTKFKNFYDAFYAGQNYDPVAAREDAGAAPSSNPVAAREDMGAAPSTSANPDFMPQSPAALAGNVIVMFSLIVMINLIKS
jgi:hypothetical protein